MMPSIDKRQVERQFSRAANTYDEAACVQHLMSDRLLQLACTHFSETTPRILDLGCGTGYSMGQLQKKFPQSNITGVDLSHNMLARARNRLPAATFIQADMEHLQFQSTFKFDLVFSNASIQWCDLSSVLHTAKKMLSPGGLFVYSSFGPETHLEIARAWDIAHPGRIHHIDFLTESDHLNALDQAGFDILDQYRKLIQPRFDSARSMLSSVKRTGATNASNRRDKGLLSRKTYARFLKYLGQSEPLELSYETLSFVARIPD